MYKRVSISALLFFAGALLFAGILLPFLRYPSVAFFHAKIQALAAEKAGDYTLALEHLQSALSLIEEGDTDATVEILTHLGACHIRLRNFSTALKALFHARRLVASDGTDARYLGLTVNIGAAYLDMNDTENSEHVLREAVQHLATKRNLAGLFELYVNLAKVRAKQGAYAEAAELLAEGHRRSRDPAQRATVLRALGEVHLDRGDAARARECFERGLATLGAEPDAGLFEKAAASEALSRVDLLEGNAASALSRASIVLQQTRNPYLSFSARLVRAEALRDLGKLDEAIADFRHAEVLGRNLAGTSVQTDRLRIAQGEAEHQKAARELSAALAEKSLQTGDVALAREALTILESSRALALRVLTATSDHRLDPHMRRRLDSITQLEKRLSTAGTEDRLRLEQRLNDQVLTLSRMDVERSVLRRNPPHRNAPSFSITNLQHLLSARNTAAFSLLTTDSTSVGWIVTGDSVELFRLCPLNEARPLISALRRSILQGGQDHHSGPASLLYTCLFGSAQVGNEQVHWKLSVDSELANVPWPALKRSIDGEQKYLVAAHSLALTPSLTFLNVGDTSHLPARSARALRFLGVADPVLNFADPRLQHPVAIRSSHKPLTRLPGSMLEIEASAQHFPTTSQLLVGTSATRSALAGITPRNTDILHFATHILVNHSQPWRSAVVLSLDTSTESPDLLSALDIVGLEIAAQTVVLSGCESASGTPLSGEGVLGLPRAFLAAGASNVVATNWETDDSFHEFFDMFYQASASGSPAPEAVRMAQLDAIKQQNWASHPRHWAAVMTIGTSLRVGDE